MTVSLLLMAILVFPLPRLARRRESLVTDRREMRFDWVLAFYYPQDTMEDMGPSAIIPGTQFDKTISSHVAAETTEPDLNICGPAGTVALIHFDAWHRASANTSSKSKKSDPVAKISVRSR